MLISASRGLWISTKALVDCLKVGQIREAALDVYENEKEFFFNEFSQQVHDNIHFLYSMKSFFFYQSEANTTNQDLARNF